MSMEVPSSSVEGERNPLRSNTLDENSWWIGIIPGWEQPMEPIIPTFQHCFAWVRACRISMNFSTWFMLGWVGGFNCPENSWTSLNIYQLYSRWRSIWNHQHIISFQTQKRKPRPLDRGGRLLQALCSYTSRLECEGNSLKLAEQNLRCRVTV